MLMTHIVYFVIIQNVFTLLGQVVSSRRHDKTILGFFCSSHYPKYLFYEYNADDFCIKFHNNAQLVSVESETKCFLLSNFMLQSCSNLMAYSGCSTSHEYCVLT